MPQFQTATISKTKLNDTFYLLTCTPQQPLSFLPGQYLIVRVNPTRVVQYSIVSAPSPTFDLLVQYIPGGQASEWVKNDLHDGDTIQYYGPLGIFTFHQEPVEELLFLATGSGIAPFKSIIDDLLLNQHESRPIHLYFGLRTTQDLVFFEHFNQLDSQFSNFNFHVCLSRPEQNWSGKKGRITYHLQKDHPHTTNYTAYLCGSQEMIDEAQQILTQSGTPSGQIYTEKFW